jgi:hypothetical protein
MAESETLRQLRAAVDGLVYISETDAPWRAFHWLNATGDVTRGGVKYYAGHKSRSPSTEQDAGEFLDAFAATSEDMSDEEAADAARYAELRRVVRERLTGPKLVRVGRVRLTLYLVGQAVEGGWAGVSAKAVET